MKYFEPKNYGNLKNGIASDMDAFQRCADDMTDGSTFVFDDTAMLSRAIGYHTDLYGKENVKYQTSNLFLNGGQSCLIFRNKKNITVDLTGSKLFVEQYAQGLIDFVDCENWQLIGGELIGGGYIISEGRYYWLPLDLVTKVKNAKGELVYTGAGEKGADDRGFNTTTLRPDIGSARNNQFITDKVASGGYGGDFPQFDGTTAKTWGMWRGGYIGNWGYAVSVIGGKNGKITGVECHGFNGGFVNLGLQRSLNGQVNYQRISNPISRKSVPDNTEVYQNYVHDNYTDCIHSERSTNAHFHHNLVVNIGHPDSSVAHLNIDPGYGWATSRAMPNFGFVVEHNRFINCYRKGVDCHQGTSFDVNKNLIIGTKYHGIDIAIDDDFADVEYQPYFDHRSSITGNIIEAHLCGIGYANGAFGRQRREDLQQRWQELSVNISDNHIYSTNGFYTNYGNSPFSLTNNHFTYASPYAHEKLPDPSHAIVIGSFSNRGFAIGNNIRGNTFRNSKDGNFLSFINTPNSHGQTRGNIIKDNVFNVTPWYYGKGADSQYCHNDVKVLSGTTTTPLFLNANTLNQDDVIKDNIVQNDMLHKIVFTGGTGAVAYPIIDKDGHVSRVQLLCGGSGYPDNARAIIEARGRATGCVLKPIIDCGVITNVQVISGGKFYKNTYTYSIPKGIVNFDFKNVSGSLAIDTGNHANGVSLLNVLRDDLSQADCPFVLDKKLLCIQTKAKTDSNPSQYAVIPTVINGGSIVFAVKVSKDNPCGVHTLFSLDGSIDDATYPSGIINIKTDNDGFVFVNQPTQVNDKKLTIADINTRYEFDKWYWAAHTHVGLIGANIVLGLKRSDMTGSLNALYSQVHINAGTIYTQEEVIDMLYLI